MLACTTHPRYGGEVGRQCKGRGNPAWPSAWATGARVGAGLLLMAGMATAPAGSISPPAPHSGRIAARGRRSAGCWCATQVARRSRRPSSAPTRRPSRSTSCAGSFADGGWRPPSKRLVGTSGWVGSSASNQRQWSDLAILRTTPALLALFSLVTLWASQLAVERGPVLESVRWYPKPLPTFSDALALVRHELWAAQIDATSPTTGTSPNASAALINRLLLVACRPP